MNIKNGLISLGSHLKRHTPDYLPDFLSLEARYNKNENDELILGISENTRNERNQIMRALNALALAQCGISFNDLCEGKQPPIAVSSEVELSSVLIRARHALALLEEKAVGYTVLTIPTHLQIELEEKRREVAALEAQYRNALTHSDPVSPSTPQPIKGNGDPANPSKIYHGIGKAWAVLVGVNHYSDSFIPSLKVCVDDVTAIHQSLTGSYEVAKLLTDATPEHLPTRANILGELSTVAQSVSEDDLLLFYFSGHGMARDGESYLLARDTRLSALKHTAVAMKDIREIVAQSPAHAKVIVLDACHSGASIGKAEPTMTPEFIQRVFEQAEGMAVLASCKENQQSWEWAEKQRSVFTYYLLEALTGKADLEGKGFVSVSDVNNYVTDGVKTWAAQRSVPQTPTLQYTAAGDIILLRYPH